MNYFESLEHMCFYERVAARNEKIGENPQFISPLRIEMDIIFVAKE